MSLGSWALFTCVYVKLLGSKYFSFALCFPSISIRKEAKNSNRHDKWQFSSLSIKYDNLPYFYFIFCCVQTNNNKNSGMISFICPSVSNKSNSIFQTKYCDGRANKIKTIVKKRRGTRNICKNIGFTFCKQELIFATDELKMCIYINGNILFLHSNNPA